MGPFLFGYVPGFTLQGDAWDIAKTFVMIIIGTYLYAYIFSFAWYKQLKQKLFKKEPVVDSK